MNGHANRGAARMAAQPGAPEWLRSDFREEARRIVAADRQARLRDASQNTIGSIAKTLERAFALGLRGHAEGPPGPRWEDLPPRARDSLRWLGFIASLQGEPPSLREVPAKKPGERPRWTEVPSAADDRTHTDAAIQKLREFGFLAELAEDPGSLRVTPAGLAFYDGYRARSDAHDPTLPRIGMRASK